jgi:predicted ATPase
VIESIQIKNFRGIQQGQVEQFKKFNLLVGPNNSGKTTILESLYLAGTLGDRHLEMSYLKSSYFGEVKVSDKDFLGNEPTERILARHSFPRRAYGIIGEREYRHYIGGTEKSAFGILQPGGFPGEETPQWTTKTRPVFIVTVNNGTGVANKFEFSGDFEPDDIQRVGLFGLDIKGAAASIISFAADQLGSPASLTEEDRFVFCWDPNLSYQQAGSAKWAVKGKSPKARHTLFFDYQVALSHLPMSFFRQMITTVPGWTQKIAERFQKVLGIEKSFNVQFLPTDQEQQWVQGWIAPFDMVALTIDSYGDGARSVFKVLTPLLALSELAREDAPGLFLWEEPELFQNPQTLIRLLTEVAELLKGKSIQVFIATHSLEVAAIFVQLVQDGLIAEDELSAIRLNLHEGKLASSTFNHREIQTWTEMDLDLRVPSGKVDSPLKYQFRETANAAEHTDDD